MVAQTKKYQKCTLQGINRFQRLWKVQKGPNFGKTGVQKYRNLNSKANCQVGTLEDHKWTNKMVVQMKQYQNCTLKGINSIWGLRNVQKGPHFRPNFGSNGGQKYKIFNFKANFPIGTL